ncbi:MAG: DMT family transporter [Alphaproteobacteria bacterium]|nr:DMT family transporter [Alphaproteobacteria bacterium]
MLLGMFIFACMDATTKYLSQSYAITQIVWVRYMFFAVFALFMARAALRSSFRSRRPLLQVIRALLLVCEMSAFILAFRYMPLADVHAIAAASPLIVTALSVPLLGERVGLRQWIAVLVGLVGVLIIVRPGFATFHWSILVAVAGALLWGFYQIQLRVVARHDRPQTTIIYSAFVGLAATSVTGPLDWRAPDLEGWTLLFAAGVMGALAHFCVTRALDLAPAALLQPYSYALLVAAAIVGFIVFGQFPDQWTILGALIVTGSGIYAWHSERSGRA